MVHTVKIEVDLMSLMEVLNQTGNPTVAVQILNGTYQEPEIYKADRASSPDKDGNLHRCIFVSYDRWIDVVHYKYKDGWARQMSREKWADLELWEDVMNSQVVPTYDDQVFG